VLNNKKGFTIIESIVVILIVGVCLAIWGFHGRDHMKIAMMSEAKVFIEKVISQEKMYRANNGAFIATSGTAKVDTFEPLYINTKTNNYFKTFKIIKPANTLGTIIVEVYPDTTKYPDMSGYYIRGVYNAGKDIVDYDEFYG